MTDLNRAIEKGNKRMMIVCIIWATIGAIPLLILSASLPAYSPPSEFGVWQFAIIGFMIWVIFGTAISPKIVNKIWKND